MVKKTTPNKVLKALPAGFSIREVRKVDSKTNQVTSSYITIYRGKKEVAGLKFKNVEEAESYFNQEEVAKR